MKRLVAIHDLSGLGRVSLNAVIPVLSTLGVQVCPLPTAILSSGTSGYAGFHFVDLTASMKASLDHWESLHLQVEAVYSGFLGSPAQVELVSRCAQSCLKPGGLLLVDPVMGDNGLLEPTMDREMVERMRWLTSQATCITPNLTEAALLLGEEYSPFAMEMGMTVPMAIDWLHRLAGLGPAMVVITSAPLAASFGRDAGISLDQGQTRAVLAYDKKCNACWMVPYAPLPAEYPGSGDTFASVLTGFLLKGLSLQESIDRAVQCVYLAMQETIKENSPPREGLWMEEALASLRKPLAKNSYFPLPAV